MDQTMEQRITGLMDADKLGSAGALLDQWFEQLQAAGQILVGAQRPGSVGRRYMQLRRQFNALLDAKCAAHPELVDDVTAGMARFDS